MKPTQHDIPLYQKLPYFDMKTLKVNKTVLRVLTTPRNEKKMNVKNIWHRQES